MSENQELTENQDFDDEIDILLYQNGAEKTIEMLKFAGPWPNGVSDHGH